MSIEDNHADTLEKYETLKSTLTLTDQNVINMLLDRFDDIYETALINELQDILDEINDVLDYF